MYGRRQVPPTWRHLLLIHRYASKPPGHAGFGKPRQMFNQPELLPISRLLAETGATDIVINGHEHAALLIGGKWRSVESGFVDETSVAAAARLLISLGGRQIDQAHPWANVDIDGKLRVHAILASAINSKTHISIRVHAARSVALEQLVQVGMVAHSQAATLRKILARRESFIISGAAGVGKTTLLRALLSEAAVERVITIEDVAELNLNSATCVHLVSRSANVEGAGEVSMQQLLIESLRMRPDRIAVGEIRSAELLTWLQAINTGHCASATIHANSIDEVADRMVGIAIASGLLASDVERLIAQSVDWLIHISSHDAKRSIEIRRNRERS